MEKVVVVCYYMRTRRRGEEEIVCEASREASRPVAIFSRGKSRVKDKSGRRRRGVPTYIYTYT